MTTLELYNKLVNDRKEEDKTFSIFFNKKDIKKLSDPITFNKTFINNINELYDPTKNHKEINVNEQVKVKSYEEILNERQNNYMFDKVSDFDKYFWEKREKLENEIAYLKLNEYSNTTIRYGMYDFGNKKIYPQNKLSSQEEADNFCEKLEAVQNMSCIVNIVTRSVIFSNFSKRRIFRACIFIDKKHNIEWSGHYLDDIKTYLVKPEDEFIKYINAMYDGEEIPNDKSDTNKLANKIFKLENLNKKYDKLYEKRKMEYNCLSGNKYEKYSELF